MSSGASPSPATNPTISWLLSNKTHIFAWLCIAVAGIGYFTGMLTQNQATTLAGLGGGLTALQSDNNMKHAKLLQK
jgi:hypothetical protein